MATVTRSQTFLTRAQRLDKKGEPDAALDVIYDGIDQLMRDEDFAQLDEILKNAPVRELSVDLQLGLLTASLPAKNRLPSRAFLFKEIESSLKERGQYEDALLAGL